jgi:hypothetical protein
MAGTARGKTRGYALKRQSNADRSGGVPRSTYSISRSASDPFKLGYVAACLAEACH